MDINFSFKNLTTIHVLVSQMVDREKKRLHNKRQTLNLLTNLNFTEYINLSIPGSIKANLLEEHFGNTRL